MKLLDHMQHNNITPVIEKGQRSSEMPPWMSLLNKKLTEATTERNVRLFIARLIVNRSKVHLLPLLSHCHLRFPYSHSISPCTSPLPSLFLSLSPCPLPSLSSSFCALLLSLPSLSLSLSPPPSLSLYPLPPSLSLSPPSLSPPILLFYLL